MHVRERLERALDLPAGERPHYLQRHLTPGPELEEALALMREVERVGGFLEEGLPLRLAPSSAPLPPRVGSFEIDSVLGWGSMGVVYLGRQAEPPRQVAVKLLRMDVMSVEAVRRMEREAEALARLTHPGVAGLVEAGSVDLGSGPQPYVVMEYVDGESLRAFMSSGSPGPRECARIVAAVAEAVVHAHAHGVLHRDLKPENIQLRADGRPVVLDFGVAHVLAEDDVRLSWTATGQILGTLAYMAPEQARGTGASKTSDQFALGAMLHEMVTGELPFQVRGQLPHLALRVIADGNWRPPPSTTSGLPRDLVTILSTALAGEPSRRYPSVLDLQVDLERFASGRRVLARPPSRLQQFAGELWRYRFSSAVFIALLVTLGAVVATAAWTSIELRKESAEAELLADRQLLSSLVAEADSLWPRRAADVGAAERWLASAAGLRARRVRHRADAAKTSRQRSGARADWIQTQRREFLAELDALLAPGGPADEVARRRREAASMYEETVDRYREEWLAVGRRVRGDPRFAGRSLSPQEGLVPLGPDPASGLEEFAVLGTGRVPLRPRPEDALVARLGEALVLVLIPGGNCQVGARQYAEWSADGREATHHEGPAVWIELDDFMIGKFELTQDQWTRWFGSNPSTWEVGSEVQQQVVTALSPAESMNYRQLQKLLPRLGLTLPTEAQWETASRGGSELARIWGEAPESILGFANISHLESPQERTSGAVDSFRVHGPVGSFPPNGYGLHDVLGNVFEVCLDDFKVNYHRLEHRAGDGRVVVATPDGEMTRRGGCFDSRAGTLTVALRRMCMVENGSRSTGARACWLLPRPQEGTTDAGPRGAHDGR